MVNKMMVKNRNSLKKINRIWNARRLQPSSLYCQRREKGHASLPHCFTLPRCPASAPPCRCAALASSASPSPPASATALLVQLVARRRVPHRLVAWARAAAQLLPAVPAAPDSITRK
ncbi:hypothetical protein ZWY2020_003218 [Hordeum vulgare]|nr:hypothetical protein ZWY2020_003218 [Hordeum vulgare]